MPEVTERKKTMIDAVFELNMVVARKDRKQWTENAFFLSPFVVGVDKNL